MKEHIIRAILYQDMSVKWKDAELNGDVNVHLNVHQKTRQFVEAELGDFLLSDGEWILAAFEKVIDGETNHINPTAMEKLVAAEKTVFQLRIPTLVHNTPGEWGLQFYLVTNYNPAIGEYKDCYPFDEVRFVENSSFFDDGLTIPGNDNLSLLYNAAVAARNTATAAVEDATSAAERAETAALEADAAALDAAQEAADAVDEIIKEKLEGELKVLYGGLGQPTFFLKDGHLFARILKGSVNPYRIENGHLKMTIVREVN